MSRRRDPLHGAALLAPEELFSPGESPEAPPVRNAARDPSPPDAPVSLGAHLWSALKLLSGLAVVVGSSLAVAFSAHHYALSSPRFAVQQIDLSGARRITLEHVRELGGIAQGANIFALDTDAAEQKLLGDPWISEVKITRKLPSTLRVELSEREPTALASIGERLYLVTREGAPFKEFQPGDPYDLPLITGASPENLFADRVREIERIQTAIEVLRQYERLPESKVYPAEEVHLADSGDVTLNVGKDGLALELGAGPWRKKLLMAGEVIGELRKKSRSPGIVFLDNQAHPERVVVRMR
jgi:cell division protein FtsQ